MIHLTLFGLISLVISTLFLFPHTLTGQEGNPQWKLFNTSNSGIPSDVLFTVYIDTKDNIWVGTNQYGAGVFDGTNWNNYTTANSGLQHNRVTSIIEDHNGVMWFGTDGGGLAKFDGENWESFTTSNSPLPHHWVTDIKVDKDNTKWIGTDNFMITYDDSDWTLYNSGLSYHSVAGLALEGDSVLWVGTGFGLNRYNFQDWTIWYSIPGLPAPDFWKITVDPSGIKWICTSFGLLRFDDNEFHLFNMSNSPLLHEFIMNVTIDGEGKKWIATWGGVAVYDDVNWTIFNTENSLLQTDITRQVGIDKYGNKWIATDEGLLEYNENGIHSVDEHPHANTVILSQNHPNPFCNSTIIPFRLTRKSAITLKIYDASGCEIATLVDDILPVGNYSIPWTPGKITAGIYILSLETDRVVFIRKMMVLK